MLEDNSTRECTRSGSEEITKGNQGGVKAFSNKDLESLTKTEEDGLLTKVLRPFRDPPPDKRFVCSNPKKATKVNHKGGETVFANDELASLT